METEDGDWPPQKKHKGAAEVRLRKAIHSTDNHSQEEDCLQRGITENSLAPLSYSPCAVLLLTVSPADKIPLQGHLDKTIAAKLFPYLEPPHSPLWFALALILDQDSGSTSVKASSQFPTPLFLSCVHSIALTH